MKADKFDKSYYLMKSVCDLIADIASNFHRSDQNEHFCLILTLD